ncbi:hypothetical protein NPIL_672001 [Nephila pilipes]|uniref:Uncharacterized protein n=1 Tax=Nephila pilipes TaxID=299642 RepID=A0A8X6TMQ5_NEPPI|nr:hypothetical protein NPIL_672001 [Nephila pilipes]
MRSSTPRKKDPLLQLIRLEGSKRAVAMQLNSLQRSPKELNMPHFTSIPSIPYAPRGRQFSLLVQFKLSENCQAAAQMIISKVPALKCPKN